MSHLACSQAIAVTVVVLVAVCCLLFVVCCLLGAKLLYCVVMFQPIGALNPARLSHLQERFDSWEEDRVPPFFYGTHYSTMAFVLHWLVRVVRYSFLYML